MSLRKIGQFYWLDIRIKGVRIRRSLKTTNKEIALVRYPIKKKELLSEYGQDRVRLADFINKYVEWAWATKPASAKREEQRLKIIQEILSKDKILFLDEINPYIVEGIKVVLRKRGLSKSTVNQYLHLLRRLYRRASDWDQYEGKNPAKRVRLYTIHPLREAYTATILARIISKAKEISQNPRSQFQRCFYDLVILAINTGMRRSEILNLRWREIKEDEIIIKGKGEKKRGIPLNQTAKNVILSQPKRSEYVFLLPSRTGTWLFDKTRKRIKRDTGIDFSFHKLRHTFATILMEKGIDLETRGSILGHSSTTMTLLYSHVSKERKQKAVDLLCD